MSRMFVSAARVSPECDCGRRCVCVPSSGVCVGAHVLGGVAVNCVEGARQSSLEWCLPAGASIGGGRRGWRGSFWCSHARWHPRKADCCAWHLRSFKLALRCVQIAAETSGVWWRRKEAVRLKWRDLCLHQTVSHRTTLFSCVEAKLGKSVPVE